MILPPSPARRRRFEQLCHRVRTNDPTLTNLYTTHLPVPCDNRSLTQICRALVFNSVLSDLTIGIDEILPTDEGTQLLADWLRESNSLEALTMEVVDPNRNLSERIQIAQLLSQCVIGHTNLRQLDLRQVDLSGFVEELSHVLSTSPSLTKFVLAKCECEEGLPLDVFAAGLRENTTLENVEIFMPKQIVLDTCLAALRGNKQLRTLSLCHTFYTSIEHFLRGTKGLRELIIKDCCPQPAQRMAQALESHPGVRRLVVSNCGIDQQDARHLARMLRYNEALEEIDLSRNHIGNTSAALIVDSLRENRTLRCLNLERNLITFTNGDRVFQDVLDTSMNYTHLDISGNNLRGSLRDIPEGIRWVSTSLGRNSILLELNLSNCRLHNDGTARIAASLKQNNALQLLNVSDNHIDVEGVRSLIDMMLVNESLVTLIIESNPLGDECGQYFADFLGQSESSSLKELHMKGTGVTDATLIAITATLEVNCSLAVLNLDGNNFTDSGFEVLVNGLPRIAGLLKMILPSNEKTDLVQATMIRNKFVRLLEEEPVVGLWPHAFEWGAAVSKRGTTGMTAIFHVLSHRAGSLLSPYN